MLRTAIQLITNILPTAADFLWGTTQIEVWVCLCFLQPLRPLSLSFEMIEWPVLRRECTCISIEDQRMGSAYQIFRTDATICLKNINNASVGCFVAQALGVRAATDHADQQPSGASAKSTFLEAMGAE